MPDVLEADQVTLEQAWTLSDSVALRPEPFGALAYHFGNRRLTFLKHPALVRLVTGLADASNVGEALAAAEIPRNQWPAYLEALTGLAAADMVQRCEPRGAAA